MKVSEVMHSNPVFVTLNESLSNVAKQMKKGDFGSVLVKEGNQTMGIVTDRDIVVRALANGDEIKSIKAQDIMSKNVVTCRANDTIENAASTMKSKKIRRLAVVDDTKITIGIISLGDIAQAQKGKENGPTFEALEKISEH